MHEALNISLHVWWCTQELYGPTKVPLTSHSNT